MPLTGTAPVLAASLRAAMLANPATGAVDGPALTAMCNAIATTVLAHLVAQPLTVTTTGTAAAQTGQLV